MSHISKSERIRQLKEVLKKKHDQETELRLKSTTDPQPFNRFSKYRRSCGSVQSSNFLTRAGAISTSSEDEGFQAWDPSGDPLEGIKVGNVQELATSFETHRDHCSGKSDSTLVAADSHLQAQSSDHKKFTPSPVQFQSKEEMTEGRQSPTTCRKRIPSILKRKDENHSSGGASVSFDPTISEPITRTKSTDSNLSCDTETGYWSGGENLPSRILKSRSKDRDLHHNGDQKSILKDRRSSLGSTSSSPESSLHGILKRKLSYDSSTILHGANSFSTNSLDSVTSSEPKPILKKKSSSEDLDETEWINPKPILKKQSLRGDYSHSSSSDGLDDSNIRPILKKSVQLEEKSLYNEGGFSSSSRGILKRTGRKGTSNYYSMEESLQYSSADRDQFEDGGYYGYGVRHGSLPNPENVIGDLSNLTFQMDRRVGRTDSEEDIISTLTVAEKRSIFIQMERENAAAGASVRVEKRHATQPVTLDEIEKASQLMQQQISTIPIEQLKSSIMKEEPKQLLGTMLGELCERNSTDAAGGMTSNVKKCGLIPRSASIDSSTPLSHLSSATGKPMTLTFLDVAPLKVTESSSEEDPSKLSLRERVKLFNTLASPASSSFCRPVKRPVMSKRFQTQPVTDLEHRFIRSCVGIGPREVKANVVDKLELLQSPKGSRKEVDCGEEVASKAVPLSDEDDEENEEDDDNEMHDKLRCHVVPSDSASSSDEEQPETLDQEQSFLKKRVKSPTYEISEMEVDTGLCEKSGNIAAKIAALKTNGEMNWKKRICKPIIKNVLVDEDDNNRNIEITANNKDSPSVIANRLSLLTKSQTGWKQRVSENDATDLTVQSKLEKAGKLVENAILSNKKSKALNNILTPTTFASKGNKTTALTEELEKRLHVVKKLQYPPTSPVSKLTPAEVPAEVQTVRSVNVSANDNEAFCKFFPSTSEIMSSSPSIVPPTNISLDDITTTDRQFLGVRRNVLVKRNHAAVRNPIKSLASRLPEQSYTELTPEVREKELKKRIQVENLSKTSHLSVEALAGLVSKEDFTAVKLKRAEKEPRSQEIPYPLLIRIKGKRFVQIRLVPPLVSSLSSGDCFILITKEKVYQYVGEFSNRMEKSKLADTLTHLTQKRDLGVHLTSLAGVVTIEAPIVTEREDVKNFFKALGGEQMASEEDDVLGDAADEAYETGVIRTNRVFEVDPVKEELIPLLADGGWGSQPKFSILKEDKVLVFDFGSEMYVWSGSRADPNLKRTGTLLAREMFEDSYNFSEVGHEYSPLGPQLSGDKRPNWCWFKRVTHHMEPILFIEKFFDWPDESGKLIRIKTISESSGKDGGFNFTPCDVNEMMEAVNSIEDPILELEGFNVSRGSEVHDKEHRYYVITTLEVTAWRISEFSKSVIREQSLGHFYSTETYVVRWQYSVMNIGRDLKGNQSKHGAVIGRPRTAYFFWHGKDSKATEQGTSALMTVELDEEKCPQVRVVQGREPPAFLALFNGLMFVHLGSPEECAQRNLRVYVTMGCEEKEGHFVEVPAEPKSFRSRGSFLVVDKNKGNLCLWHGCHTSTVTEKIAQKGAKYISTSPAEVSLPKPFRCLEMREGEETKEVWERLGIKTEMEWRESYTSLRAQASGSSQITVFQFTTLNGILEVKPLLSPKRKMDTLDLFSVLQEDLYNVRQPGLFLVTHGSDVWLWHGWIPRGDEDNENTSTGSGEYRWAAERKAALETAVSLVKYKNGRGLLVHAGLEPPLFRCLFPYWSVHQEARECNLADGKFEDGAISLSAALELFKKKTYTLQELQERPEGVDLLKLEDYLSDADFLNLLKMSRKDFEKLQQWRKTEIKKQVGLF